MGAISRCIRHTGLVAGFYISTTPFRLLPRRPRHIAVTRLDNIGDFILWLNGARAIRRRYPRPDHHLTLIASAKWDGFAEASGLFDEVIAVDPERFLAEWPYRRMICRDIARCGFETAINPTYSRNTLIDDLLVKATGAPVIIGQAGDLSNAISSVKPLTDRWYSELVPAAVDATHELEKNWHFAKRFDPNAVRRVHGLELGMVSRPRWLPQDKDYFVIFPGGTYPIRLWPIERFREIAKRIHARTGWTAVVCGAVRESEAARKLIEEREDMPVMDACGQTSLSELAGVIAGARLTVTNDTSAVHLAAAVGAAAVAILGGGHFGRFLPYPAGGSVRAAYHSMPCYQCNWHCIHPRLPDDPAQCITSVTVEQVWAIVEPMLETVPPCKIDAKRAGAEGCDISLTF
jgi:ADP-heptose:LPS heptosyltransferase